MPRPILRPGRMLSGKGSPMTAPTYSDADYRADLLAMTLAMLPTLDRWLAEVGRTRAEAMALMRAGEPPPTRNVKGDDHEHE